MRKLRKFRPKLITKTFFSDWADPRLINYGQCFIWAYYAQLIFKNIKIYDVENHAFIKYKNKFYDSEVLKGSKDYEDLPATEGALFSPMELSVKEFKKRWGTQPERFDTSWKEIEYKARKFLRKYEKQCQEDAGSCSGNIKT